MMDGHACVLHLVSEDECERGDEGLRSLCMGVVWEGEETLVHLGHDSGVDAQQQRTLEGRRHLDGQTHRHKHTHTQTQESRTSAM
jgi:hypothetical protein